MAYFVVQLVNSKPEGGQWWAQANPEAAARLREFVKGTGLVKRTVRRRLDANTMLVRQFYNSEADYNALMTALESNPDHQARVAWGAANNVRASKSTRAVTG